MSQVLKVLCQVCGEHIANTTIEALSYPLKGSMFQSPDPAHGVPAPWQPAEEWEDMRCPYGRIHRAMVCHGIIQTDQGMVVVPSDGTPARIDSSVRMEIDRDSIPDRTIIMPEDQAAKLARAELGIADEDDTGEPNGETEERKGEPEAGKSIPGEKKEGYECPVCGKQLKTERGRDQHIKMTHELE